MEDKGQKLMDEAEKGLNKFSFFSSKEEKYEKARDKFLLAATQFKAAQNWVRAAAAYERAADMSQKTNCEIDFINDIENAAMNLRKAGDKRALTLLTRVIDLYDKQGKYTQAAKFCVTMSEDKNVSPEEGLELLQRAAKYYKNENARATAAELVQKTADMMIRAGKYEEARKTYEKLATEALDDRMTRMMSRKFFFMALLCELANIAPTSIDEGLSQLRERFEAYQDQDNQLSEHTREHMLIKDVLAALEAQDVEQYEEAVAEYDSICPMDQLKTKMLLRGKQLLRQQDLK